MTSSTTRSSIVRTHYDNLKVARNAPPEVIRAAYRALAQRYHPDRNAGNSDAGRIFGIITRAFDALSDPERRRKHDAWIAQQEGTASVQPDATFGPEEYEHSSADVAATPALTSNIKQSVFGKIWTHAMDSPWPIVSLLVAVLVLALMNSTPTADTAPAPPPASYVPVSPPMTVDELPPIPRSTKLATKGGAPGPSTAPASGRTFSSRASAYQRSSTASSGYPWPSDAGYVSGFPILNTNGNSTVTVDNTRGSSDVFVKLFSLDGPAPHVVRACFVPAQQNFTMRAITPGTYDVRYRDLDSNRLYRFDEFDLSENTEAVENGTRTRYSSVTLTLFRVLHGNARTYPISESEF